MVSIQNISVSFGSFDLLSDISFLVNNQDRIGLAGKNGAGKSTLLKLIAGQQNPTSGRIERPKDFRIGYLPQQMKVDDTTTVLNETLRAFSWLMSLSDEIEKCSREIAQRDDYESDTYLGLCDHLAVIEERFRMMGGNSYIGDTEQVLTGLGFERDDFDRPTRELSGGWRMRIEIAKLLLSKPDMLLLDEPTNHLDIESIQWLESFLETFQGAAIVVSHDRAFLDNTTRRTIEISLGKIYDYRVSWSEFVRLRQERREQQVAAYRNQRKMIDDTEKFIERFRYKATKAVQVQSKIKQLDKLERLEVDEEDNSSINVRFASAPRSGSVVIEAENLSKSFGSHVVLDNIRLTIERGEKIAFVGRNGEGKTTLSRIIIGELDSTGLLKKGHNVRTGYFAQNQDELLDENLTVFETIDETARGEIRTKLRDLLGAFLFRGDDADKKVSVLSGGERSRLAIIKLLLEPYNLLVLDEPTNHLDIRSKDILKEALIRYDGTLIVVSHDRDFLNNLVDKVYEFRHRKVRQYIGGIYDFLRKKKIESLRDLELKQKSISEQPGDKNKSANRIRYEEKKEFERTIRKLKKRIEDLETDIEKTERELEVMGDKFTEPLDEEGSYVEMYRMYKELKSDLNEKMNKWTEYTHELEMMLKNNQ